MLVNTILVGSKVVNRLSANMAMTESKEESPLIEEQTARPKEAEKTQAPVHSPYNTGRWTDQEHEDFINGLRMYGKNWDMLAYSVKTRSATQVRSHAQKFFLKCASKYKRKIEPEYVSLKQNTAVLDLCISSSQSNKVPRLEGTYSPQYETLPLQHTSERYQRQHHSWGPSQSQSQQSGSETRSFQYSAKHIDYPYPAKNNHALDAVHKPTIQRYSSLLSELSLYEAETKEHSEDFYLNNDALHVIEPLPYRRETLSGMADAYAVDYSQTELLI